MKALTHIRQCGTTLIEVLVTLLVTGIGLLGIAGLQYRVQLSDMETYQRSQALTLLEDMASRITTNRSAAVTYVTGSAAPLGAGMNCPTSIATRQEMDAAQWCNALQGAAEMSGTNRAGAMIGARGCIENLPNDEYLITVAWQGLSPVSAPPLSIACGRNLFDGGGDSPCTNDLCRRVVTTVVRIADLN